MNNGHLESIHEHEPSLTGIVFILTCPLFTQLSKVMAIPFRLANTFGYMPKDCNARRTLKVAWLLAFFLLMHSEWASGQQTETAADTVKTERDWWKELFGGGSKESSSKSDNRDVHPDSIVVKPDTANVNLVPTTDGWDRPVFMPDTLIPLDTLARGSMSTSYVVRMPSEFEWNIPRGIAQIDSLGKVNPVPLQGYRVQIYFGDLQQARAIRAGYTRDHPDAACHLVAIDPNFAVTVGNFRDRWTAEKVLRNEILEDWPRALVVPCEIDFPRLE